MLTTFKSYLTKTAVVKEKYVPYYLKWVSSCYVSLDKSESEALNLDDREQFLKHLSKTNEDWQVNQADNALRIYEFFLSSNNGSGFKKENNTNEQWAKLEISTREALRLRHLSYKGSVKGSYFTFDI